MTVTNAKSSTGLTALATATGPAVNWKEPLGTSRSRTLDETTKGCEIGAYLPAEGDEFSLVAALGMATNTGSGTPVAASESGTAILWTAAASGQAGNLISREIAAATAKCATSVQVSGTKVKVIPGTKARMTVSGLTPTTGTADFKYAGLNAGRAMFSTDASLALTARTNTGLLFFDGTLWNLKHWGSDTGAPDVVRQIGSLALTPDLIVGEWAVGTGTGTVSIAAGASSYAQVIAAVLAEPAAAFVVPSQNGSDAITGAAVVAAATFLGNGADAASLDGGAGNDVEGNPLGSLTALTGFEITCLEGAGLLAIGGVNLAAMTAGAVFHLATPNGSDYQLGGTATTFLASAANTRLWVTVLGL